MRFDPGVVIPYLPALLSGFGGTLWLCALSGLLACALGVVLIAGRRRGPRPLAALIDAYIALTLALPLLVLLYVTFYVLPDFGLLLPPPVARLVPPSTAPVPICHWMPRLALVSEFSSTNSASM